MLAEILTLPTTITVSAKGQTISEDIFRSYHILQWVKSLANENTPPRVIGYLIAEVEKTGAPVDQQPNLKYIPPETPDGTKGGKT